MRRKSFSLSAHNIHDVSQKISEGSDDPFSEYDFSDKDSDISSFYTEPVNEGDPQDVKNKVDDDALTPEQLIETLKSRLRRRNDFIMEMRKAYLRDVVAMKNVIWDKLKDTERFQIIKEYKDSIPSLDLRQPLELYAPYECYLEVLPCSECGGHIEIVHRESSEMERLTKSIAELQKRDEELRLINATHVAQLESVGIKLAGIETSHNEEVHDEDILEKCVTYPPLKQSRIF